MDHDPLLATAYPATRIQARHLSTAAQLTALRFALAPPHWSQPMPESTTWSPLVGHPLIRRTWATWPANSRRRDLGHFITAFATPD
ncbi:MAG: hypothetical protein ACJ72W_22175 [Actinoallomurus sp.]